MDAQIDQVVISVINPTTANAGTDQALCRNSAAINLAGTPGNGTWSGSPLVTAGGLFTPSGAGTYTLTYSIGSGTCASSDQVLVTVHDLPTLALTI